MTQAAIRITLREWETRRPDQDEGLAGRCLQGAPERSLAERLAREGLLEVTELRSGLMLRSFSHVGSLRLGGVEITVEPKIEQASLLGLLRYAYGFRKLRLLPRSVQRLGRAGFADLLVCQLLAEAGEIAARGLHRSYFPRDEWTSTPRGRLDLQRLASRGVVADAVLPCRHHPRVEDTPLNRVLRAGLVLAAEVVGDLGLRRESRRRAARLGEGVTSIRLDAGALEQAERGVNRLTAAYAPALLAIRLLRDARGVSLSEGSTVLDLPGYLFDMNRFFQALLSRFLRDNLPDSAVRDDRLLRGMMQYAPGYNPLNRRAPAPRPDFVITRAGRPVAVLDAKYRDLWENPLPRDMLYQVAIYAVGHERRTATILYPTTEDGAKEARIDVNELAFGGQVARVSLRPVALRRLGELIDSGRSAAARRSRTAYAKWLVTGE